MSRDFCMRSHRFAIGEFLVSRLQRAYETNLKSFAIITRVTNAEPFATRLQIGPSVLLENVIYYGAGVSVQNSKCLFSGI
jgi:hypothetical protein